MTSRFLFFAAFMVFIIFMLALDLGVFHKKDHVIKIKEAAIWTGIWVLLAMLFGLLLRFKAEWVHGITTMDELLESGAFLLPAFHPRTKRKYRSISSFCLNLAI